MNGFVVRDVLIERVWYRNRTTLGAAGATSTIVLDNIARLFHQRDGEIARLALNPIDLGHGQDFYVGVSFTFQEFWRFNAHGAVIGWKGFVKLGHLTADGGSFFNQINPESCRGQIKGGLNTADTGAHNHDIAESAVFKNVGKSCFKAFVFHVALSFSLSGSLYPANVLHHQGTSSKYRSLMSLYAAWLRKTLSRDTAKKNRLIETLVEGTGKEERFHHHRLSGACRHGHANSCSFK
jgi:hypothetical protein